MYSFFDIFPESCLDFMVKFLDKGDTEVLQELFEECKDFSLLVEGVPPSPNAAQEALYSLPEGKEVCDKFVLGLFDNNNSLLAMIESIRTYPHQQSWWIGLMMVAPDERGRGLGSCFYRAFEDWVLAQDCLQISLGVVEINTLGLRFWKRMGFEVIKKTALRTFGIRNHSVYVLTRKIIE